MPDITLDTLDLRLARNKGGVRGISFLHAVDEPGEPGRVGTIVFDQLHHGLGNELAVQADRYIPDASANPPLMYVPGSELPVEEAASFTHASSFQHDGDVYFVLPRQVLKVLAGDGLVTVVFTPTGDRRLSGVPAFYDGDFWIGLVDDIGVDDGHAHFDTSADVWNENIAGADRKSTHFFTVHGGMFSMLRQTAPPLWNLGFTDATDPDLDVDWSTIVPNRRGSVVTAMHALGRFVLVFMEDGQIVAAADAPPVKSLSPPGVLSDNDPFFGHGARQWGADLIVPGARGLLALNIDRLAGRDVSPRNIQGALGDRTFRPSSAMTPFGPDLLVGTFSDDGGPIDHVGSILVLRRYPEGVFYNFLADITITGVLRPSHIAAMEYIADSGKLTMLEAST